MTRALLLACLAIASGLHARALPDSTRDALLMGVPAWDPATGRVLIVEAPVTCEVGMLPQIFLLDAKRGRSLKTWGPLEVAENNDAVAARHGQALLARLGQLLSGSGVRTLRMADSLTSRLSSDGRNVSFQFRIDGEVRTSRPLRVPSSPVSTWWLWSLPELPWALVAGYVRSGSDGCERGPDFRIVRLAP